MRRLLYLLLLVLFVSVSATCVNASTDCERWFAAYRAELAHSRNLQRIAAAKRRAKLYASRKIAQIQPRPKVVLARGPRMTRKQTLHHFNLACGVLPEDAPARRFRRHDRTGRRSSPSFRRGRLTQQPLRWRPPNLCAVLYRWINIPRRRSTRYRDIRTPRHPACPACHSRGARASQLRFVADRHSRCGRRHPSQIQSLINSSRAFDRYAAI